MSQGRWLTCLWPGLAELWLAGCWSGLFQAVGFAVLLNGALAATLVWTDLVSPETRFAGWTAVATLWLMGVWSAWRTTLARREPDGDLFSKALSEYLQGNWFAAEAMLERLMKADPRDIEARLLLATLFRRTARLNESRDLLEKLARSQGAEKWAPEIARERELLDQTPVGQPAESATKTESSTNTASLTKTVALAADDKPINTSRAA
jgi:hypothetical protein